MDDNEELAIEAYLDNDPWFEKGQGSEMDRRIFRRAWEAGRDYERRAHADTGERLRQATRGREGW